jgi:DNA polymerase V
VTTKNTGIPVSVGIAPTKTLAKIANHFAKKRPENNGVYVIESDEKRIASLKEFPVGEVWGIGRQYEKLLIDKGVKTAFDFIQIKPEWVQAKMSVVGVRTQQELKGVPCNELEVESEPKQEICVARSFGNMQTEYDAIAEAVSSFAARCAAKLRRQKSCAGVMLVYIHTNEHRHDLPQYAKCRVMKLPVATSSDFELCSYAKHALKSIFVQGYHYKKAGVVLNEIVPENEVQTSFLDEVDRGKQATALQTLDKVNNRYGKDTVRLAAQGYDGKWKLRQEKLSPSYTTRWEDLITIKC